ncbi:hypothetical protein CC2G_013211 [Coprinopsis cinerea AmutBmut pab1-1]|nr:hypothetical protein CC2G_013211 [Coprinopsis cinerea AmutBmut pab1-1]
MELSILTLEQRTVKCLRERLRDNDSLYKFHRERSRSRVVLLDVTTANTGSVKKERKLSIQKTALESRPSMLTFCSGVHGTNSDTWLHNYHPSSETILAVTTFCLGYLPLAPGSTVSTSTECNPFQASLAKVGRQS